MRRRKKHEQGHSKPLSISGGAGRHTLPLVGRKAKWRSGGFRGQEAIPHSIPLMSRLLSGRTPESSRRPAKPQAILPWHLPPLHLKPPCQS